MLTDLGDGGVVMSADKFMAAGVGKVSLCKLHQGDVIPDEALKRKSV